MIFQVTKELTNTIYLSFSICTFFSLPFPFPCSPISVFPRPRQLCLMSSLLLIVEIISHAGTRGLIMGNIDSSPNGLLGTQRGPGHPRKSRREKNLQFGNLLHRPRVGYRSTKMCTAAVHTGGFVVQTSSLEIVFFALLGHLGVQGFAEVKVVLYDRQISGNRHGETADRGTS